MDETAARAMITDHLNSAGVDEVRGAEIYADNAVLEFPQGRERITGRTDIVAMRTVCPAQVSISVERILGRGDLWVNEYTISYDGSPPQNVVSIMEFSGGKVCRERLYVCAPWEVPAWRAQWVQPMT